MIVTESVMAHTALRAELGVRAYNIARSPHATESSRRIFERLWLFYAPRSPQTDAQARP